MIVTAAVNTAENKETAIRRFMAAIVVQHFESTLGAADCALPCSDS